MARLNMYVVAVLAIAALALDTVAFGSRCLASPKVNVPILLFGLAVQALAVCFPLIFGGPYTNDSGKRGVAIIGMALLLFVAGSLAFRYASMFSDAIGQPNYFKSTGLACRNAA